MSHRILNAYANLIVGSSIAGFVYGTTKGLSILDNSMTKPSDDFRQKKYAAGLINSMTGASFGFIAGGFFGIASPILVPTLTWACLESKK
ncbi:hypothetical protein BNJ_00395 [Kaumoebavirus]|uniref:hypothetical protein n=1 Tax=Kaumoebavirus TaxID=1859492 RepID=UPI0009C219EF|nr:hypothetical protein BNJ_00395 [Kaumoebavirus]ARA72214.1 hypothetical protein BNJ_00395 [Kaumoebavirus]